MQQVPMVNAHSGMVVNGAVVLVDPATRAVGAMLSAAWLSSRADADWFPACVGHART
jgi:hypothetical protein